MTCIGAEESRKTYHKTIVGHGKPNFSPGHHEQHRRYQFHCHAMHSGKGTSNHSKVEGIHRALHEDGFIQLARRQNKHDYLTHNMNTKSPKKHGRRLCIGIIQKLPLKEKEVSPINHPPIYMPPPPRCQKHEERRQKKKTI